MHRIKRVKLELTVAEEPLAAPLLGRASALHERAIAPLLAHTCDDLMIDTRLIRLDRVEVDVGVVSLEHLEDDLIRKLAPALRAALIRALEAAARPERAEVALELLMMFACTGNLPWWADPGREDPVAAALAVAIGEAPRATLALLRTFTEDPPALARLARHCDDRSLAQLVAQVAPSAGTVLLGLLEAPGYDATALARQRPALLTGLARPNTREAARELDAAVQTILAAGNRRRAAQAPASPREHEPTAAHRHEPTSPQHETTHASRASRERDAISPRHDGQTHVVAASRERDATPPRHDEQTHASMAPRVRDAIPPQHEQTTHVSRASRELDATSPQHEETTHASMASRMRDATSPQHEETTHALMASRELDTPSPQHEQTTHASMAPRMRDAIPPQHETTHLSMASRELDATSPQHEQTTHASIAPRMRDAIPPQHETTHVSRASRELDATSPRLDEQTRASMAPRERDDTSSKNEQTHASSSSHERAATSPQRDDLTHAWTASHERDATSPRRDAQTHVAPPSRERDATNPQHDEPTHPRRSRERRDTRTPLRDDRSIAPSTAHEPAVAASRAHADSASARRAEVPGRPDLSEETPDSHTPTASAAAPSTSSAATSGEPASAHAAGKADARRAGDAEREALSNAATAALRVLLAHAPRRAHDREHAALSGQPDLPPISAAVQRILHAFADQLGLVPQLRELAALVSPSGEPSMSTMRALRRLLAEQASRTPAVQTPIHLRDRPTRAAQPPAIESLAKPSPGEAPASLASLAGDPVPQIEYANPRTPRETPDPSLRADSSEATIRDLAEPTIADLLRRPAQASAPAGEPVNPSLPADASEATIRGLEASTVARLLGLLSRASDDADRSPQVDPSLQPRGPAHSSVARAEDRPDPSSPASSSIQTASTAVTVPQAGTADSSLSRHSATSDELFDAARSHLRRRLAARAWDADNADPPRPDSSQFADSSDHAGPSPAVIDPTVSPDDEPSAPARRISDAPITPPPPRDSPVRGASTPANTTPPPRTRLQPPRPPTPRPPPAPRPAPGRRPAQYGDFRVDDAGLVLLWPFLERLFVRTGLQEEPGKFIAGGAMQAVALLGYLATGKPALAEYSLPLAKLLIGLRAEDEYVPGDPPTPEQLAECDRMLAAALDHASIIKDAGIEGLRAAYLRRPALLNVRDAAWLLRVERRPHDALLGRLPWSWSWIKLDWMYVPLQVEW